MATITGSEVLAQALDGVLAKLARTSLRVVDVQVPEQVLLELPMKALCRDDCRGLCPTCGADLNAGPCGCREEGDERLAKLKSLLTCRRRRLDTPTGTQRSREVNCHAESET